MSTETRQYPHITVTQGMSGWFAVMLEWNEEFGGYAEPYDTGIGRYELQADAIAEGEARAKAEGVPFYPPKLDPTPARQDVLEQIREIIPDIVVIELD